MKIKRKTEVKVQSERFLMIRKNKLNFSSPCVECGARLITPEEAALFFGRTIRTIYREIENGIRHFTELSGDKLLVCSGVREI